jgi:hypothetical protein
MCFYLVATGGNENEAQQLKSMLAKKAFYIDDDNNNWYMRGKMVDVEVIFPLVEMYECQVKIYNIDSNKVFTISPVVSHNDNCITMMLHNQHYYRLVLKMETPQYIN